MIEFHVQGSAATKGSWRAVRSRSTGRAVLLPDNERERSWSTSVSWAAKRAMAAAREQVADGPVRVEVWCHFERPKRTKFAAPPLRDADKLARSVLDALTGIAYVDDGQVVQLLAEKAWAEPGTQAHALVRVARVVRVDDRWTAA